MCRRPTYCYMYTAKGQFKHQHNRWHCVVPDRLECVVCILPKIGFVTRWRVAVYCVCYRWPMKSLVWKSKPLLHKWTNKVFKALALNSHAFGRVATVREKSLENEKKIQIREKSGNFGLNQGNWKKKWQKSGNFKIFWKLRWLWWWVSESL